MKSRYLFRSLMATAFLVPVAGCVILLSGVALFGAGPAHALTVKASASTWIVEEDVWNWTNGCHMYDAGGTSHRTPLAVSSLSRNLKGTTLGPVIASAMPSELYHSPTGEFGVGGDWFNPSGDYVVLPGSFPGLLLGNWSRDPAPFEKTGTLNSSGNFLALAVAAPGVYRAVANAALPPAGAFASAMSIDRVTVMSTERAGQLGFMEVQLRLDGFIGKSGDAESIGGGQIALYALNRNFVGQMLPSPTTQAGAARLYDPLGRYPAYPGVTGGWQGWYPERSVLNETGVVLHSTRFMKGIDDVVVTLDVPFRFDESFDLQVMLAVACDVVGYDDLACHADAGSTAYWDGIRSVRLADGEEIPGFSVQSESGFDWTRSAMSVPEPASWLLMAMGVALLSAWERLGRPTRVASRDRDVRRGSGQLHPAIECADGVTP
ncbi:MAG: hypothetical protein IPK20_21635 [Betaproteobacteria bacterium]|nr:hypothetical protein [Betaproteobacteria bacterium]